MGTAESALESQPTPRRLNEIGFVAWALWALSCFIWIALAWARGGAMWAGAWAQWMAGAPLLVWAAAGDPPRAGRRVWALLIIIGVACRALLLPFDPAQSDDLYRYIWEGRIQLHGFNPYAHAPLDPALAALRDPLWARINHPEYSAIYPPLTQMAFAALAWISPTVLMFKLFFTACDLGVWWALARWLRRRGRPVEWSLIWGLNPLVIGEFAGSGHLDSLMILTLVLACAAYDDGRLKAGLGWLGAATAAKLLPIAAAPFFFWRARPRWIVAIPALALAAGYLIYAGAGAEGLSRSLWMYQRDWVSNAPAFDWMRETWFADDGFLARKFFYVGLLILALALWTARVSPTVGAWAILGAYFTLGPVAHPWYLTLFAALACGRRGAWPWVWLTCAAPLAHAAGHSPCGAPLIRLLIWGPFFIGMAAVGARELNFRYGSLIQNHPD